jgi:hypothetical protein
MKSFQCIYVASIKLDYFALDTLASLLWVDWTLFDVKGRGREHLERSMHDIFPASCFSLQFLMQFCLDNRKLSIYPCSQYKARLFCIGYNFILY